MTLKLTDEERLEMSASQLLNAHLESEDECLPRSWERCIEEAGDETDD